MNLNGYIKKFGKYTFEEKAFNDVDAIVLAELAMCSLEKYANKKGVILLKNIDPKTIDKEVVHDSPDRAFNKTQLKNMVESKRFQDCIVKDIDRRFSVELVNQFYAITIVLPNGNFYVAFRGTDITLVGWKEDFYLAIDDKFLAQDQGLEYLKKAIKKNSGRFYVGGHSKGGNVSVYACLNLPKEETNRLIHCYSFDGPGLRKKVEEFPSYEAVEKKIIKYRTYYNMIGAMFNQTKRYKVVHSTGLLFGDVFCSSKLTG